MNVQKPLRATMPKARHPRPCDACRQTIPEGEVYAYATYRVGRSGYGKRFVSQGLCTGCSFAEDFVRTAYGVPESLPVSREHFLKWAEHMVIEGPDVLEREAATRLLDRWTDYD